MACGVSGEDGQDMQHTSQGGLMFRNLNQEDLRRQTDNVSNMSVDWFCSGEVRVGGLRPFRSVSAQNCAILGPALDLHNYPSTAQKMP